MVYINNMTKLFRISITADKWPTTYTVEAGNPGTAVTKAFKQWKKTFKGSRADKWSITVYKSSVPTPSNGDTTLD